MTDAQIFDLVLALRAARDSHADRPANAAIEQAAILGKAADRLKPLMWD